MLLTPSQMRRATRRCTIGLRAALLIKILLVFSMVSFAQTDNTPPGPTKSSVDNKPLTSDERAELLKLIRSLQERVEKLEGAQPVTEKSGADKSLVPTTSTEPPAPTPSEQPPNTEAPAPVEAKPAAQDDEDKFNGRYTPNLGFKIANTEYGDLNVSIYSYVRYLNQLGLDPTYTDAFGNTKNIQRRQDMQLLKLQIKFLGWILNPKLRYFLYAWTSNSNQGQGAQVVLAGNLQYSFNKYITLGGGIRSLPGTRSVEGNFPFWTNVDSRMIADEFMRPSYTSGIWAMGNITDRVKYVTMLGNNMSTLGVPSSRIDNKFNTWSNALIWFPTGDFEQGFSGQGWGDFGHHKKFSTRAAFHYSRSDENKESQPNSEAFENTQIRLSDGTVIFTPNIFGEGVSVSDVRWQMSSFDGGFKYKGFSVEGEYYLRWLDNFRGTNVENLLSLFDHGFQIQGTAMLKPKTLQAYVGHSKIYGQYGDPWDFRTGLNFFPFKSKVLRWNNEALYLSRSPVGYTSVPYNIGSRGWAFHSSVELAF